MIVQQEALSKFNLDLITLHPLGRPILLNLVFDDILIVSMFVLLKAYCSMITVDDGIVISLICVLENEYSPIYPIDDVI